MHSTEASVVLQQVCVRQSHMIPPELAALVLVFQSMAGPGVTRHVPRDVTPSRTCLSGNGATLPRSVNASLVPWGTAGSRYVHHNSFSIIYHLNHGHITYCTYISSQLNTCKQTAHLYIISSMNMLTHCTHINHLTLTC